MPDDFVKFFSNNPFWAAVIIVFMVLPILGAIAWVIARALKKPENSMSNQDD